MIKGSTYPSIKFPILLFSDETEFMIMDTIALMTQLPRSNVLNKKTDNKRGFYITSDLIKYTIADIKIVDYVKKLFSFFPIGNKVWVNITLKKEDNLSIEQLKLLLRNYIIKNDDYNISAGLKTNRILDSLDTKDNMEEIINLIKEVYP